MAESDQAPGDGPSLQHTLKSHCYDWPPGPFSKQNFAKLATGVSAGQPAIEFTLKDTDDNPHTLSELLATRPVLMVFGSFT